MSQLYTRCIHIFPKFDNAKALDDIRAKYDHLHSCIEPHITLVFPFESDLAVTNILEDMSRLLREVKAFKVSTSNITGVSNYGHYLFLNIDEGHERICDLHYKLHEGILSNYQSEWTKDGSFQPHITIGRFKDSNEMEKAVSETMDFNDKYSTLVDRLYIEIIGANEASIIDGVVTLSRD